MTTPHLSHTASADELGPIHASSSTSRPDAPSHRPSWSTDKTAKHGADTPLSRQSTVGGVRDVALEGDNEKGGAGRELTPYGYGFFAPELAELRKTVYKILGVSMAITIFVMWTCLPLYWGSLWKSNQYTHNLTVRVLDFDGSSIGNSIASSLLSETTLKFFPGDTAQFPTAEAIAHDVVQEGVWATIAINANATSSLAAARALGDAAYSPASAISVYYVQARQETATNNYLVPLIQAALKTALAKTTAQSVAEFISANAGNQTAMENLARAPLTINPAVAYTLDNLRPYNQPVASAITLVGLIYMLIFAVIMTMVNNVCRQTIGPYLTTRSYIIYRLVTPMGLFFVLSFFFAMVSLPFDVNFDAHYTYAGGFFLWAFTVFLGMASTGLAAEFAITVLTDKFLAYFMIPLIIANVSVASMPHELQPAIFRYGAAMPFYNVSRVVRTIIFDTKNEIAKNLGILLAWTVLSFLTISLATWLIRRKELARHAHASEGVSEKRV